MPAKKNISQILLNVIKHKYLNYLQRKVNKLYNYKVIFISNRYIKLFAKDNLYKAMNSTIFFIYLIYFCFSDV